MLVHVLRADVVLAHQRQAGVDGRVHAPAARIGLDGDVDALEARAQVAHELLAGVGVAVVHRVHPGRALQAVARPGDAPLGHEGGGDAAPHRHARPHPLGEGPVLDALAVARRLVVADADGVGDRRSRPGPAAAPPQAAAVM